MRFSPPKMSVCQEASRPRESWVEPESPLVVTTDPPVAEEPEPTTRLVVPRLKLRVAPADPVTEGSWPPRACTSDSRACRRRAADSAMFRFPWVASAISCVSKGSSKRVHHVERSATGAVAGAVA